jgi:hypothetical protein
MNVSKIKCFKNLFLAAQHNKKTDHSLPLSIKIKQSNKFSFINNQFMATKNLSCSVQCMIDDQYIDVFFTTLRSTMKAHVLKNAKYQHCLRFFQMAERQYFLIVQSLIIMKLSPNSLLNHS